MNYSPATLSTLSRRATLAMVAVMVLLMGGMSVALAEGSGSKSKHDDKQKTHVKAQLNAQALKALLDAKLPVVVLDARGATSDRIPGAIALSYDADKQAIEKAVADTNSFIVTYCGGPECPMSQMLADSLAKNGYKNVVSFKGGVEQWTEAGYELETDKSADKSAGSKAKKKAGSGSRHSGSGTR